mmetsp:Transcript_77115/g.107177  ORF Transcript_77115/g.107177 Transcript_77115/m.107177 type:complete len:86 (-) Transcript_77115:354-611(-)
MTTSCLSSARAIIPLEGSPYRLLRPLERERDSFRRRLELGELEEGRLLFLTFRDGLEASLSFRACVSTSGAISLTSLGQAALAAW